MLIDDFLPEYDFEEIHATRIKASPESVFRAVHEVDYSESTIIRWLFRLRGLPSANMNLDGFRRLKFEVLGETLNREVVIGLIGRFWTLQGDLKKIDADSFKQFDSAGYAKTAFNLAIEEDGNATRLMTETRIKCTDDESRRNFGFYWMFIRPFSGLVRTEMLKLIKQRAELAAI